MGAAVIGIGAEIAIALMGTCDQRCISGQVNQDIAFGFDTIGKRIEAPAITGLRPGFGKTVNDHLEFGETATDGADFSRGDNTGHIGRYHGFLRMGEHDSDAKIVHQCCSHGEGFLTTAINQAATMGDHFHCWCAGPACRLGNKGGDFRACLAAII